MAHDHFPARLRELREAMGWSQQELAERVGLHMQTVSRFERGMLKPTWEVVLTLAEALGVDCRAFCQAPAAPPQHRGPGRPRKNGAGAEPPPAPPAPPPAEDLEGQAEAGPAATRGSAPKRPRARRPRGK
jgi:transcriptional regulator with XRE-family HTH domain